MNTLLERQAMKLLSIILITLFLLICDTTNIVKATEVLPQKELSACHGIGIIAEDLANIRDEGTPMEETFYRYLRNHSSTPKSLHQHLAVMTKSTFDYSKLKPEAFLHVYNYACLASFQDVSLRLGRPYLLESAQKCQDSINRPSMLSGCIQHAYNELLRKKSSTSNDTGSSSAIPRL